MERERPVHSDICTRGSIVTSAGSVGVDTSAPSIITTQRNMLSDEASLDRANVKPSDSDITASESERVPCVSRVQNDEKQKEDMGISLVTSAYQSDDEQPRDATSVNETGHPNDTSFLNVLIVGATGVGKRSTINALAGSEVVQIDSQEDNDELSPYRLKDLNIWNCPGFGDTADSDRKRGAAVGQMLQETTERETPLIDVVLLVLDASSRDLGTAYAIINDMVKPALRDGQRLLIGINQCDLAMKGRYWDQANDRPKPELQAYLVDKMHSIHDRMLEATALDIPIVCYSAGFKSADESGSPPYNLHMLVDAIWGKTTSDSYEIHEEPSGMMNAAPRHFSGVFGESLIPTPETDPNDSVAVFASDERETSELSVQQHTEVDRNISFEDLSATTAVGPEASDVLKFETSSDTVSDSTQADQTGTSASCETILSALMEAVQQSNMSATDKKTVLDRIRYLGGQKLQVLILVPTSSCKSSTINAIFGKEIAPVGTEVNQTPSEVQRYVLGNFVLWESPGLGGSHDADKRHRQAIQVKLNERDDDGNLLIDLVLVILDGGSRDLGTSLDLINNIIVPNLGTEREERLRIGINQADRAMKGRHWDFNRSVPDDVLQTFLDQKAASVERRVFESTGLRITPVYYSAGTRGSDVSQEPYNLAKLLYDLVGHTPDGKRFMYIDRLNRKPRVWESNDRHKDYLSEVTASWNESANETLLTGMTHEEEVSAFVRKIDRAFRSIFLGVHTVIRTFKDLFDS